MRKTLCVFALSFSQHLMLTLFDTTVFPLIIPTCCTQADICVASDYISLPPCLFAPGDHSDSDGSIENTRGLQATHFKFGISA